MKGRKEEAECIVRLDQMDGMTHVCVCSWPAMYRKMMKLYGPSLDHGKEGQSSRWVLPLKTISFRRLPSPKQSLDRGTLPLKHRSGGQFGKKKVGIEELGIRDVELHWS